MDKDEHDKAVDNFFSHPPKHRTKKKMAQMVRSAHANGMFVANAIHMNAGVPSSHVAIIETTSRANELRRRNA